MEDFYYAGGLPAVLRELLPLLHARRAHRERQDARARTWRDAPCHNPDVIRPLSLPLPAEGGTVDPLRQPLPRTAPCSSSRRPPPHLLTHRGRAVVFEDHADLARSASTTPRSPSTRPRCWCSSTPGRRAAPACRSGAPRRSPRSLLQAGVKDMVRISDARMSGTSYGTVVLHVAPESAVGRPARAGARTATRSSCDVPERRLTLRVPRRGARAPARRVDAAAARTHAAATAACSSTTCSRPTRAWTSTSCAGRPRSAPRTPPAPATARRGQVLHSDNV